MSHLPREKNKTLLETGSVLVVDDHRQARESMAFVLGQAGHRVECGSCAAEALERIGQKRFDCIVTDLQMPGMSGIELIEELRRRKYPAEVVMVTAYASVETAVRAMRHGAFDYIEKPFDVDQLERLVGRAVRNGRLMQDRGPAQEENNHKVGPQSPVMIGTSAAMRELQERIDQVAPTQETVLIMGESGTGKELVAGAIHTASQRATGPMVRLNCPVLAAHLMESELFGHEKGAFTGAESARIGRFEMADHGSILLDEVTEIDLGLQAKLLRVLQERSFERVGASQTREVDVRVLATTNRDLQKEVAEGRFRQDLYFRLAVVPIWVPPLRQRIEDVPELVDHFLRLAADRLGRGPCELSDAARNLLTDYHWPGNVRELENLMTRVSVLAGDSSIDADRLRSWMQLDPSRPLPQKRFSDEAAGSATTISVGTSLEETERRLIEATLAHFDGHRAKTAEALGIGIRTLQTKLRQYGYAPRSKPLAKAG